jgi:4-carboxymuconolactone decarboxylase
MGHDRSEQLRRLAIGDVRLLESVLGADLSAGGVPDLDARTTSLVRLAGLVAVGAPSTSLQWCIADALAAGATDGAVLGVLAALVPVVGTVRVAAATPDVLVALGGEVDVRGDEP